MAYTFNKTVEGSFDEVKNIVIDALKAEKFGVISEINFSGIIKTKLEKDIQRYEILGACSPKFAFEAVMEDEDMGAFLPCNVTLNEKEEGKVKVSIVNPIPYMMAVENEKVKALASEVADALKRVSESL
ncbi:MAG: DUF302 domain-containing protein [Bacteroidota bacterium]